MEEEMYLREVVKTTVTQKQLSYREQRSVAIYIQSNEKSTDSP